VANEVFTSKVFNLPQGMSRPIAPVNQSLDSMVCALVRWRELRMIFASHNPDTMTILDFQKNHAHPDRALHQTPKGEEFLLLKASESFPSDI
jgi:hypothetical protein